MTFRMGEGERKWGYERMICPKGVGQKQHPVQCGAVSWGTTTPKALKSSMGGDLGLLPRGGLRDKSRKGSLLPSRVSFLVLFVILSFPIIENVVCIVIGLSTFQSYLRSAVD